MISHTITYGEPSNDRRTLPKGRYEETGVATRQVFELDISRWVTEYQAQRLINLDTGKAYTAPFPDNVTKAVQYGNQLKAHAVYLSQYQLPINPLLSRRG